MDKEIKYSMILGLATSGVIIGHNLSHDKYQNTTKIIGSLVSGVLAAVGSVSAYYLFGLPLVSIAGGIYTAGAITYISTSVPKYVEYKGW